MRIEGMETEKIILQELGRRLGKFRVNYPMTQAELAEEAGLSLRTIARMENGETIQLNNLIKVMKALRISGNLELLVPDMGYNPNDLLQLGKERQRATSPRYRKKKMKNWVWGEDR